MLPANASAHVAAGAAKLQPLVGGPAEDEYALAIKEINELMQLEPMNCDPSEENSAMDAVGGPSDEDWTMGAVSGPLVLEESTNHENITGIH